MSKSVYRTYTRRYISKINILDHRFEGMDAQRQKKLARKQVQRQKQSLLKRKRQLVKKQVDKTKTNLVKKQSRNVNKPRITTVRRQRRKPRMSKRRTL